MQDSLPERRAEVRSSAELGCRRRGRASSKEKPQASENEEYAAAYVPPSDRLHHRADRGHQRPEDHDKDAYSRVSHRVRLKECVVDLTFAAHGRSDTRSGTTR